MHCSLWGAELVHREIMKRKKGSLIPDRDHVIRHVPLAKTRRDSDGKVCGILPQAIERRDSEEYLSVSHYEHFSGSQVQKLFSVKNAIASGKRSGTLGIKGLLAKANVGNLKQSVEKKTAKKIRVAYLPTKKDSSHSGVYKLPEEDSELMDALASEAFSEIFFLNDIK